MFLQTSFSPVDESDIYAISPALCGETMAGQRQDGRGPVVGQGIKRSLIITRCGNNGNNGNNHFVRIYIEEIDPELVTYVTSIIITSIIIIILGKINFYYEIIRTLKRLKRK